MRRWFDRRMLPVLCCWLWGTAALLCGANLVVNGDFAILDAAGFPARFYKSPIGDAVGARVAGPDGAETAVLAFELTGAISRIEQHLPLQANRRYRVGFKARTEAVDRVKVCLTTLRRDGGNSVQLQGTSEWQSYEFEASFPVQEREYLFFIYALAGSSGKVWFTDVEIEEILENQAPTPLLPIARLSAAPVIDGKLDDAVWQEAPEAAPFVKIGKTRFTEFAAEATTVKVGYDGQNLYAAFRCAQRCLEPLRNTIEQFKMTAQTHDGDLFADDCVMLLIQALTPHAPVYDLAVNGAGVISDARCPAPDYWAGRDLRYSSGARAATEIGDGFWTVEIAMPWRTLGLLPRPGMEFNLQLGRINIELNESSTYFPMAAGFHTPAYFGRARLIDTALGVEALAPGRMRNGDNQLQLTLTQPPTDLTAVIRSRGEAGGTLIDEQPLAHSGEAVVPYRLAGKVYNFVQFELRRGDAPLWIMPQYVIDSTVQARTLQTAGEPRSATLKLTQTGAGNYFFAAEAGLYDLSGAQAPLRLGVADRDVGLEFAAAPEYLLVNFSRFWPETGNEFHIVENSLQPLHVVLDAPYLPMADLSYAFELAVPAEFNLYGVAATKDSGYLFSVGEPEAVIIDQRPYRRYTVKTEQALPVKPLYGDQDLVTLLLEVPASGESFEQREAEIFYSANYGDGRIVEAPGTIKTVIYPPLSGKIPTRFQMEMWGGRMVNLSDHQLMIDFMLRSVRPAGFTRLQNLPVPGMEVFGVINPGRFWGRDAERHLAANPADRRINYQNQPVPDGEMNVLCTTFILEDAPFQEVIAAAIERVLGRMDVAYFDYESPALTGTFSCYCERCRTAFARAAGLAAVPTHEAIPELREQWIDFMTGRLAEITAMFRKIMNQRLGKQLSFYSGYLSARAPVYYTVDWHKIGPNADIVSCGYFAAAEVIAATVTAVGDTPLLAGVGALPWLLTSRDQNRQISLAELLKGTVAGAKGVLCYNLPCLNGISYRNFGRVAALWADYETTMYDGERHQRGVAVSGVPQEAWTLFEAPDGGEAVLIVYNDSENPAMVDCRFDAAVDARDYYRGAANVNVTGLQMTLAPFDAAVYIIDQTGK